MSTKLPASHAGVLAFLVAHLVLGADFARAQTPQLLHYQGRIVVGTTNFEGAGQFKFALVNAVGTATYWSNDGTGLGGAEPGSAVTLPVTKGLYAVLLGDTTLPNMRVMPPTVFTNTDVRLRIWFNDGARGFQRLSPDQRIAAVGYAMMAANVADGAVTASKLASNAVTAANIADGAITGTKLATNSISGALLQDGAVSSNKLAAGAVQAGHLASGVVGPAQLARKYDAGRLDVGTGGYQPGFNLDGTMSLDVPYHFNFSTPPIITFGVENLSATAQQSNVQVSLAWKSTNQFALKAAGIEASRAVVRTLSADYAIQTQDNPGKYNSLALVNGYPAVSYYDDKKELLFYARAKNELGSDWGPPVLVDPTPGVGVYCTLGVVNGRPAIAYYEPAFTRVKFVIANDADGTTWRAPVIVSTNLILDLTMEMVNGNPAVAFSIFGGSLRYQRASASDGSAWGQPVTVFTGQQSYGPGSTRLYGIPSLKVVGGNPALALYHHAFDYNPFDPYADTTETNSVLFIRASDVNGTTWNSNSVVRVANKPVLKISLEMVNGNPAIAFATPPKAPAPGQVHYVRASDANGTAWGVASTVDSGEIEAASSYLGTTYGTEAATIGEGLRLRVVNGVPAVMYRGARLNSETYTIEDAFSGASHTFHRADHPLRFARATDANGATWREPVDVLGDQLGDISFATINGFPAATYQNEGALRSVTASSTSGDRWETPSALVKEGLLEMSGMMGEVSRTQGGPLVLFHDPASGDLKALGADDAMGVSWNSTVSTADSGGDAGYYSSLALLNSDYGVAYRDNQMRRLRYVKAEGNVWSRAINMDESGDNSAYPSLAWVNGLPMVAYYEATFGDLKVAWGNAQGTSWGKWMRLDQSGDVGLNPCVAVVNGTPAISYLGGGLKYIRADDAFGGKGWSAPVLIDSRAASGASSKSSLLVVNGFPAIAYQNLDFGLIYIRAANTNGTAWGQPAKVDSRTGVGAYASMAIINGRPAIAYYDSSIQGGLRFTRANDANGATWPSSTLLLDSGSGAGAFATLSTMAGRPVVFYSTVGSGSPTKMVLAGDTNGTKWGAPVVIDLGVPAAHWCSFVNTESGWAVSFYDSANGTLKFLQQNQEVRLLDGGATVGKFLSAALVNTYPAASYYDELNGNLKYVRALNAYGTAWGTPRTVDTTNDVGLFTSLQTVNGRPAIAYYDATFGDLKYVRAADNNGVTWGAPIRIDTGGDVGRFASLTIVNGNPAIAYYDGTLGNLKYVRATDADGVGWGVPLTPDAGDANQDVGQFASLAVVNGSPAIAYYDAKFGEVKFVRANDTNGAAWGVVRALDKTDDSGRYISLRVFSGKPVISYYEASKKDLKILYALDASGTQWADPLVLDAGAVGVTGGPYFQQTTYEDIGKFAVMTEVNGFPSISYWNATQRQIKNYLPVKPFQINWFAVEP